MNIDQQSILKKMNIQSLNPMQVEAIETIHNNDEVVLISDTGTGKTLAFMLPLVGSVDKEAEGVQSVIITPTRELAIQIGQVARDMGTGCKIEVVYGGRSIKKDKEELLHAPSILIATPGRLADHLRRETFDTSAIHTLVLDEYDKSLEIGFEEDVTEILEYLTKVKKKILTSATTLEHIPRFLQLQSLVTVDYSKSTELGLNYKVVNCDGKDKLESLYKLLCTIGLEKVIVFINYKDAITRISNYLKKQDVHHGIFHGSLEQRDRERTLIQFRNGSTNIMLATDLAARGIDISDIASIIHYHFPHREEEYIHRNGRTARMQSAGDVYLLRGKGEDLPHYVDESSLVERVLEDRDGQSAPTPPRWSTLYVSAGRKDKISKGDLAGMFFKQGGLDKDELGLIELKRECAFVAVPLSKSRELITMLDNTKVKKRKVRVRSI